MSDEKAKEITKELKALAGDNPWDLSFNHLRVIVALERAVARLEADKELQKHLVFKGGFVLVKTLNDARFTRDLDALARDMDQKRIISRIPKALETSLSDGLWFGNVEHHELPAHQGYPGIRFSASFQIGAPEKSFTRWHKLSRIHIAVGFGDAIPKKLPKKKMKSILPQFPQVSWVTYPLEFVFSEKLQTFVQRGSLNSRARDVYDLVLLASSLSMTPKLFRAVVQTFESRETEIPASFSEFAKKINTASLEAAWDKVMLSDTSMTFSACWKKFLQTLKTLDQKKSSTLRTK